MTCFTVAPTVSHSAQAACAAFSCADMNCMIILDASLILLASFLIILPLAVQLTKQLHTVRIATRPSNSLPILRAR